MNSLKREYIHELLERWPEVSVYARRRIRYCNNNNLQILTVKAGAKIVGNDRMSMSNSLS